MVCRSVTRNFPFSLRISSCVSKCVSSCVSSWRPSMHIQIWITHGVLHSFIYSFIHSFIHSSIHLFLHSFIPSTGEPRSRVYGSIVDGIFRGTIHSVEGKSFYVERAEHFFDHSAVEQHSHPDDANATLHPNAVHSLLGFHSFIYGKGEALSMLRCILMPYTVY